MTWSKESFSWIGSVPARISVALRVAQEDSYVCPVLISVQETERRVEDVYACVAMQLKDRLTSPSLPLVMPAAGQCLAGWSTAAAPTQFQEASR